MRWSFIGLAVILLLIPALILSYLLTGSLWPFLVLLPKGLFWFAVLVLVSRLAMVDERAQWERWRRERKKL